MTNVLPQNWQHILSIAEDLRETYLEFSQLPEEGVALFGAGATGLDALKYLHGKMNVRCFMDNSPLKKGTVIGGVPVISCDEALANTVNRVLITSRSAIGEIGRQIDRKVFMPFLAFYVLDNLSRYEEIRNHVFADEISRSTLDALLLTMLTGKTKYCSDVMNATPYFCLAHFEDIGEEHFVDAGAYVGDTTERFIWRNTGLFKHLHIFEPGITQFNAMSIRMKRLVSEWALDTDNISMINAGLGEHNGKACFGVASSKLAATAIIDHGVGDGEEPDVDVWSLDSYLEKNESPVTFIKADIEGMEVQMLRGAQKSIRKYKPKLAISAYHKPWDLFDIITTVKSYVPEYNISLRHHSANLSESVLYCWVDPAD